MAYFIAAILLLSGILFISLARISADNVKHIRALLTDDKNIRKTAGSLQVIEIRSTIHRFECDCELVFTNHNGKDFRYRERYFDFDSKAVFLRDCENKGRVSVTVIYDKRSPSRHFIKELKPLEVNASSSRGYIIIGVLFMLLGISIIGVELFSYMHIHYS